MTNPQEQFFDLYRAGLKATGDMMKTSLDGVERLRTQQLASVNEALAAHANALAEINDAKSFEELVAVQARLAGAQCQAVIGYWNCIYQAAGENHAEITRRVQEQVGQIRDNFQQVLGTAGGGSAPIIQALRSLVDATSAAYALSARATQEAAKVAALQVASANAGIRQVVEEEQKKSA